MPLKLSRRSDIQTFRALDNLAEVNRRIENGENIMRLEAGQPCFGVPETVLAYARERTEIDPRQGYTDSMGMQLLRGRIAAYMNETYGIETDFQRIAVTMGSSCGFIMAFMAAFDAGDRVGICTPTYPAYKNILTALNLEAVEIPTTAETNYQPNTALLDSYAKECDGLIVCSPSNPTGSMLDEKPLRQVCQWCDEHKVRLISDEAYHRITYENPAHSALEFSNKAIVLNTFSKYFAATGWRIGWIVVPEDMSGRIKKLAESLFVSAPAIGQHVAYKLFDHLDALDEYVAYYKKNHDVLLEKLPEAGLNKISRGQGAFYLYVDLSDYTDDSEAFCKKMIDEAKVACTAGIDFDPSRGHKTMRISYAGPTEDMVEACTRLKAWLG